MRTAFVFPGQGSHRAGMASAWGDQVARLGERTGLELRRLADDPEACTATAVAQPAIAATSLAAFQALQGAGITPDLVAGHSLGEVSAAAAAGVLDPADAVVLAAERGRAMGAACAATPGGMAAVLGSDVDDVQRVVEVVDDVVIANHNAPSQLVVGGPDPALATAVARLRDAGHRVRELDVEGAFHTSAMASAVAPVHETLERLPVSDPRIPLVTGRDGSVLRSAQDVVRALGEGVLAPVRWTDVTDRLGQEGVELVVEVGPGGVLSRLLTRALPDVRVVAVADPDDLDALRDELVPA